MFEVFAAEAAVAAGAESGGGYWQLALIIAGIGILGLFARWRKARMPVVQTARQIRERDTDPGRYRDAADKALVELLETSRELNAQVDTKIRVLNRLVKDAETAAARLELLLAEGRAFGGADAPPPPAPLPEASADETIALPAEPKKRFMSDLHERIYRLKKEGHDSAEIAKATNLSTTEVEFIVKTLG
jgi:hypothetical protein